MASSGTWAEAVRHKNIDEKSTILFISFILLVYNQCLTGRVTGVETGVVVVPDELEGLYVLDPELPPVGKVTLLPGLLFDVL